MGKQCKDKYVGRNTENRMPRTDYTCYYVLSLLLLHVGVWSCTCHGSQAELRGEHHGITFLLLPSIHGFEIMN